MVDERSTTSVTVHARTSTGWRMPAPEPGADLTGGATPQVWLGAPARGGLMLPAAEPTASQLYAPRGVWLDDHYLIACDTGNHRVLIWRDPDRVMSHADADVVLGQPDFTTEGAQAGGRGPAGGMRLPTGVLVHDGRLVVADAWNHRLLVWDAVPDHSDVAPDLVLGQADADAVDENRGRACGPLGFYWPFGIAMVDGRLWVADTGNRRVLAWDGIPDPGEHPAVILGQPDGSSREENRGRLGADSFRWPHDLAGTVDVLYIADAGDHRVLAWHPPPSADLAADAVLGQPDFTTAGELPYEQQSGATLRFPYAIDLAVCRADVDNADDDDGATGVANSRSAARDAGAGSGTGADFANSRVGNETAPAARLVVADTANNRVLVWDGLPDASLRPADRVLGQTDLASHGENRWDTVADDSFCWPYGLSLHGDRVAIADSGNNRVMVWDVPWP